MKLSELKEKPTLPAFLLSVSFFVINLATVSWGNLPWLDEVMFADTSINFSQGLGWTTKAWYSSLGATPVSTYPPLYQLILSGWIRVFGISLLSVRSLTICLSFILSMLSIFFLHKNGFVKKGGHLFLFACIYWTADTFSWICRSSRVDFFNLFCVVIFFYCVFNYIQKNRPNYLIIFSGIISVLSGIQTTPYIIFILLWLAIFLKEERKKLFRCIFYFGIALLISLLVLLLFFTSVNSLTSFLVSIFSYSATLKKIGIPLLPYIGPWFGIKAEKLIQVGSSVEDYSFFEKVLKGYLLNKETLLLISAAFIVIIKSKRSTNKITSALILIGFGFVTPILMNISGRYEYYYTWMGFFPLLIGTTILFSNVDSFFTKNLFFLLTIVIFLTGLPNKLLTSQKDHYSNIDRFLSTIDNNLRNDTIVTCFNTYYFTRKLTKEVYAIGIYPIERIPDNITVLLDNPNDTYSHVAIVDLIEREASKGIKFNIIDSLQNPRIYYYRKMSPR